MLDLLRELWRISKCGVVGVEVDLSTSNGRDVANCSNVHVLPARSSNEEINTYSTFHHLASSFLPSWVFGLKQFSLGLNAMHIVLVSQE